MINSAMVTVVCTLAVKKWLLQHRSVLYRMLTLCCGSSPLEECVQNRVSGTFPPYCSSLALSMASRIPQAAAITMCAETAPPLSLTFFRYVCTVPSSSCPHKTSLPHFLWGSPWSWAGLFHCRASRYSLFIDRTVLLLMVVSNLLEKCRATTATPWFEAYWPISAHYTL